MEPTSSSRSLSSLENPGSTRKPAGLLLACVALLACPRATAAVAQERRAVVFGDVGGASIGHADSEQGRAPIFGGGAGFHLTRRLVLEGDVHGGRVSNVFGRANHDFSQITLTGSLLFRAPVGRRVHFVAGGGVAMQRAHIEINEPTFSPVDEVETIRLLHGKVGTDWDLSDRLVLRTHGVLWMSGGVDWVVGARVGLGYRF
jgi:hypothetical protein